MAMLNNQRVTNFFNGYFLTKIVNHKNYSWDDPPSTPKQWHRWHLTAQVPQPFWQQSARQAQTLSMTTWLPLTAILKHLGLKVTGDHGGSTNDRGKVTII